jgi:hypothetical protein
MLASFIFILVVPRWWNEILTQIFEQLEATRALSLVYSSKLLL